MKRDFVLIKICNLECHFAFLTTTYFNKRDINYFASFLLLVEACSATSFFLPVQQSRAGYSTAH